LAVELDVLLVRRGTALLLEQRSPDAGRMAGMWQFPTVERPGIGGRSRGLFPAEWNPPGALVPGEELGVVRHTITCHRIRAAIRAGRSVPGLRVRAPLAWVEDSKLRQLALTGMTRKILKAQIGSAGENAARRRRGAALG
jgi:adenine-specific DNA glycosylase